jgi:hypothetical protein
MAKVIAAERTRPGTRGQGSFRRVLIGMPLAALALVVLLLVGYSAATTPMIAPGASALRGFDPEAIGRLEQRAWANYYNRDWPRLFDDLLRMSRGQFGLSLPQALYASYVATQAQVVWARQGQQDGLAEEYMRRFYELVREPAGGRYDPRRAAELEVRWWAVHRQREQYPDRSALARALAETYAELYQTPVERLLAAGDARAEAMDLSDRWIREGKLRDSPLLDRIAERLVVSYRALAAAAAG